MDEWEEWRRNGLQLQLVSRWILRRLGFQIVKAQEDPTTPALQSKLRRFSPYLKDYSDYIVSRHGRLQIVDVKAPVVPRMLKRPFGSQPVNFTRQEMQAYSDPPAPIRVLLWDYGSAHALSDLQNRAFYALVDFDDFEPVEHLAASVKMRLRAPQEIRPRWLSPGTLRRLIQRSNAMGVKEIRPGCVVRI